MSDYFMGQIMMTGFAYPQSGFAQCNGGVLQISQFRALFSLLGTTYGGDGINTFGLPDLRGRTPAGAVPSQSPNWQPPAYDWGLVGGVEAVSLSADQNATHTHALAATTAQGTSTDLRATQLLAQADGAGLLYGAPAQMVPLAGGPTTTAGQGAQHPNMQPFQAINFNIALNGIYPSRN